MIETATLHAFTLWSLVAALLQLTIVLGVTLRVMLTRHPPGSAFAWILITAVIPYAGFLLYLMFGERPLGRHRAKLYRTLHLERAFAPCHHPLLPAGPLPRSLAEHEGLLTLATTVSNFPLTTGNRIELLTESDAVLKALQHDIEHAKESIDMEFYICEDTGRVRQITDALLAAVKRGVHVRLLLDDFGSRTFLSSDRAKALLAAGVEILPAMPMRLLGLFGLQRADLRLHRKSVIIDTTLAYTGSLNLIDPMAYADAPRVGAWVDAMARIEGPAVESQWRIFQTDWCLAPEMRRMIEHECPPQEHAQPGKASIVVVPSGPYGVHDPNLHLLLASIAAARHSLTITTPYFVPNDALMTGLENAALRGVQVTLILPEVGNNRAVVWAGRRHFDALLDAGVKIALYQGGLLHTKSVSIDGELALFGTVNLDNRSLHLNFETTLLVFDESFLAALRRLHGQYLEQSHVLDATHWQRRPFLSRIKEGLAYLISPLL